MWLSDILSWVRGSRWAYAAGAACLLAIAVLSLIPGSWQGRTGLPGPAEHVIAYLGTGAILGVALPRYRSLWAIGFLVAYSGLMEFLQDLSPGRDPSIADFLASSVGGLAGVAFILVVDRGLRSPHR